MDKQTNLERDLEKLMEEYYEAWENVKVARSPFKYRVQLGSNATKVFDGKGNSYFTVMKDGKVYNIQQKEFEFIHPLHLTREELLEYVDGTAGIKDVFGYREDISARNREEVLNELKEVVDELLQTND